MLKTTTEQERQFSTWVFLDDTLSNIIGTEPEYLPFQSNYDEQDVDTMSGIRIVWGSMDQEFCQEFRSDMLMNWLTDMKKEA